MTTPTEVLAAALRDNGVVNAGGWRPAPDFGCAGDIDELADYLAEALSSSGWSLVRTEGLEDAEAARIVGKHWLDAIMESDVLRPTGMSHPLAMVLAALDGVREPAELGIPEDSEAAAALRP